MARKQQSILRQGIPCVCPQGWLGAEGRDVAVLQYGLQQVQIHLRQGCCSNTFSTVCGSVFQGQIVVVEQQLRLLLQGACHRAPRTSVIGDA